MITTKKVDKLIESGKAVVFYNEVYREHFTAVIVKRDRYNIYTDDNGVYSRDELIVVTEF